jgi:hypothetical protein
MLVLLLLAVQELLLLGLLHNETKREKLMAHFAKVENGIVREVIVVDDDWCGGGDFPASEPVGQAFIASIGLDGEWKQVSYNGNFRGRFAGPGFRYDAELDEFVDPTPIP